MPEPQTFQTQKNHTFARNWPFYRYTYMYKYVLLATGICLMHFCAATAQEAAGRFRIAELNCENLFDTLHDEGFQDKEFLPQSDRKWTPQRYLRKLQMLSKEIVSISPVAPPDAIALVEVENDTVVRDLTQRTRLRSLHYKYIVTHSSDPRGLDVALLYQEGGFRPLSANTVDWGQRLQRPGLHTRDLLHVKGIVKSGDTVDILVHHAPSRLGGKEAQKLRNAILASLRAYTDSICAACPTANIIITGDFNDTPDSRSLRNSLGTIAYDPDAPPEPEDIAPHRLYNLAVKPKSGNGVRATYRYRGDWEMLDQFVVNGRLLQSSNRLHTIQSPFSIICHRFLLEPDKTYGNFKPWRTFQGPLYKGGFSDHLPTMLELEFRH